MKYRPFRSEKNPENGARRSEQEIAENKDVKITRLSYGIPMGVEIDYLDSLTLEMALEDRRNLSNN